LNTNLSFEFIYQCLSDFKKDNTVMLSDSVVAVCDEIMKTRDATPTRILKSSWVRWGHRSCKRDEYHFELYPRQLVYRRKPSSAVEKRDYYSNNTGFCGNHGFFSKDTIFG
jgi:hypothetical protein